MQFSKILSWLPGLVTISAIVLVTAFKNDDAIRIDCNQLGFYPDARKMAIVAGKVENPSFIVQDITTGKTHFSGTLGDPVQPVYSSSVTRMADLSGLKRPGKYIILVDGVKSYPFRIDRHIHHELSIASIRGFYFQRMSMPLEAAYAGKWARAAGHPDTAVLIHPSAASESRPAGTVIASPGGWYDAGDYNKYIVNSGITMGTLLSAYEDFSGYFDTLSLNIPESKDAVPDILNEVIYNLRWMLTMQDPGDGGVYHKCTNPEFNNMETMPAATTLPRYVVQKSTAATLDFVAVSAQASRILIRFDKALPGLADSCLSAAKKAWHWALQHPDLAYNQSAMNLRFKPAINTGGYGDNSFADEWCWASAEMLITTKDPQYLPVLRKMLVTSFKVPSWNNVHGLAYYSLLRRQKEISRFNVLSFDQLKQTVVQLADGLLKGGDPAYATIMGQSRGDYIWGSTAVAMNQSILLVNAYLLTKDKKYLPAALGNLDYVLGRNATGYCFVTGLGTKSTLYPHHRPSVADGVDAPVPGLIAGGPNPYQQDRCEGYPGKLPAESYLDQSCSYASNEIAINWNAPLVYVSAAMENMY